MEFDRAHHRAISRVLASLDADLLERAECYFGGGTAIVLKCGEYRESVDIDFLCSSTEGYRLLTMATWGKGLSGLLNPAVPFTHDIREIRDLRRMRDKMACVIGIQFDGGEIPIKLEVVREARIALSGSFDQGLGVPVLSSEHMYAEKLLANADRGNDTSTLSRDIIDLSMLQLRQGPIPVAAWEIVETAYGPPGRLAYDAAVARIRDRAWLEHCTTQMRMDPALSDEILQLHGGALPQPPSPFDS